MFCATQTSFCPPSSIHSNVPMSAVLNTALTEAVLKDCHISLEFNYRMGLYDAGLYDARCHCLDNLQFVIECIYAQKTTKSRHRVAKEYEHVFLRNEKEESSDGWYSCGHKWSTYEIVKCIDYDRKKHLLAFYYSSW